MRILVTNDDGFESAGIAVLRDVAAEFGEVVVVAPVANRSGASSALTLHDDIAVRRHGEALYVVHGTPADCVHLAFTGDFLDAPPALVVSGINDGANLGDDTLYSGTVGAAIEGHLFNVPAFAFSITAKPVRHYETAAAVVRQLLERFFRAPPAGAVLLNVNVPDVPPESLRGIRSTRLGRRHVAQPALLQKTDGALREFAAGAAGDAKDREQGTDFYAIEQNEASVTPLTIDLTAHARMEETARWLAQ